MNSGHGLGIAHMRVDEVGALGERDERELHAASAPPGRDRRRGPAATGGPRCHSAGYGPDGRDGDAFESLPADAVLRQPRARARSRRGARDRRRRRAARRRATTARRRPRAPTALGFTAGRERELAAAAARGNAHVLYAKLPGGARESAARTARWRPQIERAAATAGIEADELEGLVLLESAGRDDAIADPQLEGAVGLTQILAETGRNLLRMQVDPAGARRIGRSLQRALRARRRRARGAPARPAHARRRALRPRRRRSPRRRATCSSPSASSAATTSPS